MIHDILIQYLIINKITVQTNNTSTPYKLFIQTKFKIEYTL